MLNGHIVATYNRTSNDEDKGFHVVGQVDINRDYVNRLGGTPDIEYREDYSGFTMARPELQNMIKRIKAGRLHIVVVSSVDRLSRSAYVTQELLHTVFYPYKVALHISGLNLVLHPDDPDLEQKEFQLGIYAQFAQLERTIIKKRFAIGKEKKLKEIGWYGNPTPKYGYRIVGRRHETAIQRNEEELEVVQRIFSLFYYDDLPIKKIEHIINIEGIPTPSQSGGRLWSRASKWNRSSVYNILKSEAYTGKWHYHRYDGVKRRDRSEWQTVQFEDLRIISDELFDAVQEKLYRGRTYDHTKGTQHDYLLNRRITCGVCGGSVNASSNSRKDSTYTYTYYQCLSTKEKRSVCGYKMLHSVKVDAKVWREIELFLQDPEGRLETLREAQQSQMNVNAETIEMIEAAHRFIDKHESELEELYQDYKDNMITKGIYLRKKDELDTRLNAAHEVLKEYESQLSHILTDKEVKGIAREMEAIARELEKLGDLAFDRKKKLVAALDVTITLQWEGSNLVAYIYTHGILMGNTVVKDDMVSGSGDGGNENTSAAACT